MESSAAPGSVVAIDAALDLSGAVSRRTELLETLATLPEGEAVTVELTGPAPTAPALQLAAALRRSLLNRAGFAGFGPNAASCLS